MPEEDLDAVIGVDTHRDTHTAALVDTVGRQLAVLVISADAAGYARLLAWAAEQAPSGRVLWAIEGTRSHGVGLCRALAAAHAQITEVDRSTRRARRAGKSDPIDALLAAQAALAAGFVRRTAAHIPPPRADRGRTAHGAPPAGQRTPRRPVPAPVTPPPATPPPTTPRQGPPPLVTATGVRSTGHLPYPRGRRDMPRTTVAPSDPDPARRTRRSTDAPAPGAAERPPTATIRDPIGTAELKRIQKDAERLQRATEGARAAVEKEASARTQAAETGQIMRLELAGQPSSPQEFTELVTAGRELHASLQALLHNKPLWRRLAHAEAALPKPAELLPIQEVLDHDLRMLLRLLGYRRPPPEVEVAERLHEALGRMMEPAASSDLRGPRTALAEDELTLFVWRLERTLDQAEGAAPPPPAPSVRIRTAIWVRRAVEVAVPAFLSAGTVAAATSGEKEALAVGVVAGGWEVVKKFIEVGSADVLAQTLGTGALPQPDDTAKQLADHIDKRMAAVEAAAGRPPGDQEREKAVFLARRALHRALQHAAVDDRPEAQDQQPRRWEELLVLLREQDLGRAVTACRAGQDATGG